MYTHIVSRRKPHESSPACVQFRLYASFSKPTQTGNGKQTTGSSPPGNPSFHLSQLFSPSPSPITTTTNRVVELSKRRAAQDLANNVEFHSCPPPLAAAAYSIDPCFKSSPQLLALALAPKTSQATYPLYLYHRLDITSWEVASLYLQPPLSRTRISSAQNIKPRALLYRFHHKHLLQR